MSPLEQEVFSYYLPEGVFEWFNVVSGSRTATSLHVILEEKNVPPHTPETEGKHLESKGFKEIDVEDFPVRGRKTTLTFRRRVWKVQGRDGLLKRDIPLVWEGTQLEREFAAFLKGEG